VIYTRPVTEESPYCAHCESVLKAFPAPGGRGAGRPLLEAEHGTYRKWHQGCRCAECKAAYTAYNSKKHYERKARKAAASAQA
jgi:hypothetical protein